MLCFSTLPL